MLSKLKQTFAPRQGFLKTKENFWLSQNNLEMDQNKSLWTKIVLYWLKRFVMTPNFVLKTNLFYLIYTKGENKLPILKERWFDIASQGP